MSNINAHQEVKPQTQEANSPILIDSAALGKKDSIRILHVDDDPSIQELTKLMLLDFDNSIEIDSACCVDKGLTQLAAKTYDLVVSDCEMPQKNGLDFLQELRQNKNLTPFILFTGKGREEVAIKALNLGADGYINKQGNPETVYGELAHAIKISAERAQMKKELFERDARILKLASQTPGMLFQFKRRPNGTYCVPFTSDSIRNIFGCTPQDVSEDFSPITKVIFPEDLEKVSQSMQESATHLTPWHLEYRVQVPGKPICWLWGQSIPEKQEDGSIIWNGYNADITENKKMEEKLNEIISNEKILADFVRNASVAIAVGYRDGRVGQFNLAFEKLTGYGEMELEKVSWSDMLTPPEWTLIEKTKLEELEQTGKPVNYEKEYIRKNGSRVMIDLSVHPVFDKNGKVMSYYAFINDISQRKRIESQLRESEAQFKQLFSNMPSAVAVYEAVNDGKNFAFRDFNAAAERIENIKKDKVIGKRVTEVFPGVENFGLFNVFKQVWQTGESEYYPLALYKDDKDLGTWRENWVYKLPNGNIVAIYNDISERKKAEEALVQEYNKFKSVTEAIGAGLAIINKDYHVLWANDFIKRYKGDVIGKLCYATLNSLDAPCLDCGVAKIFAGKTTFDSHEYCSTNIDGKLYWVEIVATPITDGHGNITSAVEIAIDITERKKAEEHRKVLERKVKNYSEHLKCMVDLRTAQLKDANERLVKSERLAAIGELAGMIGHDLRNPLAGIKNGVYILKKKGTAISEAQAKETLEIIDKAIDHSNKIINDLLDYSREMNLKLIKYAARPLVDEAARSIQVPDRIQIVNHVDEEAFIWVDADKMIRVFVNLLQNAIDATPENGKLEITSCQRSNFVEIAFSDTGKGIPAEVLPKLFTPLFTTKAQGMGFGLAICKRIVEVHGGTIKVESVKDKGTKFIINLPVKIYPEPENKTI